MGRVRHHSGTVCCPTGLSRNPLRRVPRQRPSPPRAPVRAAPSPKGAVPARPTPATGRSPQRPGRSTLLWTVVPGSGPQGVPMGVSRRSFLTSVAAGSVLAATDLFSTAADAASPAGDVVGKITVGYQGWFACIGDGAPINGWWHWSQNWSQPPVAQQQRHAARLAGHARLRRTATRPRTPTSATARRRPCSRPTTSPPSTPTSCGCSRTAATPPRCNGSTRTAARGRPATPMTAKVRSAAETLRPQVLHHVRRHRLDEHAVGDQDRLDDEDVGPHRLRGVRPAERQAGRGHLGLRLQRRQPPLAPRPRAWTSSTGSRARAAT